jgi:hypothetical protein
VATISQRGFVRRGLWTSFAARVAQGLAIATLMYSSGMNLQYNPITDDFRCSLDRAGPACLRVTSYWNRADIVNPHAEETLVRRKGAANAELRKARIDILTGPSEDGPSRCRETGAVPPRR